MSIITQPERSVDQIIDELQVACSRVSDSVGMMHATVSKPSGIESVVGTAYCVDKRGFFITALHVVAQQINCFLSMEQMYELKVVAVDLNNDLALVQVVNRHGNFEPVRFASRIEDDAIVGGLGFPDRGLSVELCSYLARYTGPVVNGVGPHGLILEGDVLKTALSFAGGEEHLEGYSGGPIVNSRGEVVASTMKSDDDLGFIIGPAASAIVPFVQHHIGALAA